MHTIFKDFTFEACHSLHHLPATHKCHAMHGHSYTVRVFASGQLNHETGFVVDYAELSWAWQPLFSMLDHKCVNDIVTPSTSENLSQWIYEQMKAAVPQVCKVVVHETATAGCEYVE